MVRTIDKDTLSPAGATRLFGDEGGTTGNFDPADLLVPVRGEVSAVAHGLSAANSAVQNQTALHAAITAALGAKLGGAKRIVLPAGVFAVPPSVLSSLAVAYTRGLRFVGAGAYSTGLKLETGGAEAWFYDNATDSRMERVTFEGIGFYGDEKVFANGFKITSGGNEKVFNFLDCAFGEDVAEAFETLPLSGTPGLSNFLRTEGTQTADLHTCMQCRFDLWGDLLYINNGQTVGVSLVGCNGLIRGNMVYVGANGGGCVNITSGNYDLYPNGTTDKRYIVNIPDTDALGPSNGDYSISGVRFELQDEYQGIARLGANETDSSGHAKVTFGTCSWGATAGAITTIDVVDIYARQFVGFLNCRLNEKHRYHLRSSEATVSPGSAPIGGYLSFENCDCGDAVTDLSDRITRHGDLGRVRARGNYYIGAKSWLTKHARDFDLGQWDGLAGEPGAEVKTVPLLPQFQSLPNGAGALEYTTKLPEGCFLRRIYVERLTGGNGAVTWQIAVANADESVEWGASTSGAQNGVHLIDVTPNVLLSGDTNRTLRLYAKVPGTGSATLTHVAFAEYI